VAISFSPGVGVAWTIFICIIAIPATCVPKGEPLQGSIFFSWHTPPVETGDYAQGILTGYELHKKEGARDIGGLINAKAPLPSD
jgi:hypothetical protein